jgi:hypothetical protein
MQKPLILILRGEQGVFMDFNQVCVCRHTSTFSSEIDERVFLCLQDAEKVRQRRSRIVQILNVPQRVRLRSSLAAALLGKRRVSARQGWAGEKSGIFEHPA